MEFSCSECRYTSYSKAHIKRHIKNNCTLATVVEVKVDISCEFCNKGFNTKPSLKRHYTTCKIRGDSVKESLDKDKKIIIEKDKRIRELEIRLEERGDNITNNLTINVYGKPEIDYLSDQDFANLFMDGSRANANLAKRIWMDPKHPENHSILINNVSRNTAKAYTRPYNSERENPIELLDQPRIFNKMYDTCKMHFEIKSNDWEEEYHTWPESDQKKYTKLKPKIDKYHAHNEDPESNRKFNRDVKNLLIDNRDMIKKTLTNIK
jgi:hypothetical protein